jgi:CDP-glycerol glycerophosphotransferase (TagB/SpsB family)
MKLQEQYGYFKVVETGWPKMDPLFMSDENRVNKVSTIMISSTFTTRLSLAKNEEVVREIERLSKLGKWHFIAVLHPLMEKEIIEKFKSLQNEHFHFYDTTDLVPLYKQADVMLSDTTSAITEFVLQHKPVVTINNNRPAKYMINITQASEIENAIDHALKSPEDIMQNIDMFIKETHPYRDGQSSKRVIDACLDFLEHDTIQKKPLNLIRRFKIRKKLKYFKV